MAEVNANSLPAKTDLGTNDSAIVVDQTTNAGALVDLDVLADKVLDRITSKTFANQVGGSSAATLLAQLSTLNSNINTKIITDTIPNQTGENAKGFLLAIGDYLNNTYDTNAKFFCNVTWAGHITYNLAAQRLATGVKMLLWSSTEMYSATVYTSTSTNVFVRLNFTDM